MKDWMLSSQYRTCAMATSMECYTGGSSQGNSAGKLNKRHEIGEEEVQLSLCVVDMILYAEHDVTT